MEFFRFCYFLSFLTVINGVGMGGELMEQKTFLTSKKLPVKERVNGLMFTTEDVAVDVIPKDNKITLKVSGKVEEKPMIFCFKKKLSGSVFSFCDPGYCQVLISFRLDSVNTKTAEVRMGFPLVETNLSSVLIEIGPEMMIINSNDHENSTDCSLDDSEDHVSVKVKHLGRYKVELIDAAVFYPKKSIKNNPNLVWILGGFFVGVVVLVICGLLICYCITHRNKSVENDPEKCEE